MRLYVGNLSYTTTEDTLREAFSNYGDVTSVTVMKDKFTEQSKGFGFIEMDTDIMGERAIGGMNGKDIDGRRIRVSVAVERPKRDGGAKKFFKGADDRPRRNFGERRDRGERSERFGERDRKPFRGDRERKPYRDFRDERRPSADEY